MSLKQRFVFIAALVMLVYASLVLLVLWLIVAPGFERLELNHASDNAARCNQALEREIQYLGKVCYDWAAWDDTYEFVIDRNQGFIDENLTDLSYANFELDLIMITLPTGEVIWNRGFSPEEKDWLDFPEFNVARLPADHPFMKMDLDSDDLSEVLNHGVFATERGPMLFASRPIITTNDEGPARGMMTMARVVSDAVVERIVEQTGVKFEIIPWSSPEIPDEMKTVLDEDGPAPRHRVAPDDQSMLQTYLRLPNTTAAFSYVLRASTPRDVHAQSQTIIYLAIAITLISGALILIALLISTDRLVLKPVSQIVSTTRNIAKTWDLSLRIPKRCNSELSVLATAINQMMEELEQHSDTLKREQEKFRALVETLPDMITRIDRDYRYLYVNAAYAASRNATPEDCVGKTHREIGTPNYIAEMVEQAIDKVFETAKPERVELRLPNRQHIDVHFVPEYSPDGSINAVMTSARDLTERRQAERKRQRLETQMMHYQKTQSLSTMAGSIAHNFNNLLMVVLGHLQLITSMPEEKVDWEQCKKSIDKARRAALNASELSKLMLTYVGQWEGEKEVVDLSSIIEEGRLKLARQLPENIELEVELHNNLPQSMLNRTMMIDILERLLTNAVEALEKNQGTVTIRTGVVYCDEDYFRQTFMFENQAEGPYVFLEVVDDGPGMDKKTLSQIFDPYFTTKFQGRGLGLATVLGLVRSFKGGLHAVSKEAEGTCIRLLFPAIERRHEPREEFDAVEKNRTLSGGRKVLVVDDEEQVRNVTQDMLECLGYTALSAISGEQAIDLVKMHHSVIDCVILDCMMPDMDGLVVYQHILEHAPGVSVVMATGSDCRSWREKISKGLPEGQKVEILHKPYQITELGQSLARTFEQRAPRDA